MSTSSVKGGQDDLLAIMGTLDSDRFRLDPYPFYRELRERQAVYTAGNRLLFTRHRDCAAILRDRRWVRNDQLRCLPDEAICPVGHMDAESRSGDDAGYVLDVERIPDHPGIREAFRQAISPALVRRIEPWVSEYVRDLVDDTCEAGEVDLVDALAYPLPTTVICELLGIPESDRGRFRTWSTAIMRATDPDFMMEAEDFHRRDQASDAFTDYFRAALDERRRHPADDLLTALATAEVGGSDCEDEVVSLCVMILVAAQENIANHIGLGALTLMRHPAAWAHFRADPATAERAVEELLRYDSPAQIAPRTATEDLSYDGRAIRRGDMAILMLGSANHDTEVFAEPETLRLDRSPNPHLSFSLGSYYCSGAGLTRLLGRLMFGALADRAREMTLIGEPVRKQSFCLRGLEKLPVRLR